MPEGNRTAGLAQALKALADGEVASAAGVAANLLRAWPQDASVQQLMAAVAWRQSRPLEAERWALSSLALRPGHSRR